MSAALDDLLLMPRLAPTPNVALDLMLGVGLSYGTPTPTGALDLMLSMGFDPGGVPPVGPGVGIWKPTIMPRRR
jgi:hypothetical protein